MTARKTQDKATEPGLDAARERLFSAFETFATAVAHIAGRPYAFLSALAIVLIWAAIGPIVGFSDSWQLVINTSTTIITFLMVFLIQHTQNRDTLALQIKVAELLVALKEPSGDLATAEDLSEESLEQLHERFRKTARSASQRSRRRPNNKRTKPAH